MGKFIDLTGKTFGRYSVIKRAGSHKYPNSRGTALTWLCRCECAVEKVVLGTSLRSGVSNSCGCLQRVQARTRLTIHGHAIPGKKSTTYNSWHAMKARCINPNEKQYPSYGGANPPVTVCDRWKDSFENFLADLGERPVGTSLGRKGDVGPYEPGNVFWMTPAEQVSNWRPDRIRPWSKNKKIKAIPPSDALPISQLNEMQVSI